MDDRLERWRHLGPQIEERYLAAGKSQRQFCQEAGVSDTWLRPVVRGEATNVPQPQTLARVNAALHLPAGTLANLLETGGDIPVVTIALDARDARIAELEAKVAELAAMVDQLAGGRPRFDNDPEGD